MSPAYLPVRPSRPVLRSSFFLLTPMLLAGLVGCKPRPAPVSDAELTSSLNRELTQDSSIAGQPVMGAVQGGVATLTGNVSNDAQKVIAARDAAGIAGVSSVANNLVVIPPSSINTTTVAPPPAPIPVPVTRTPAAVTLPRPLPPSARTRTPAPIERNPQQASAPPPSADPAPGIAVPPPPPPAPAFRTVTLDAGSTLPVRITQTLDSATAQTGDSFSGVVASDVLVDGLVAIPAGAAVSGHVDAVQEAAHFKGSSLLTVSLASVRARGQSLPVSSDPYSVAGKGRGKNTAEKAGGGAAVGAILGGIFGGGKGAAIGAAAGGGAGAGVNGVTRGEQVEIPSETVVRFHTSTPISVRVRTDAGGRQGDSGLQPRSNQ